MSKIAVDVVLLPEAEMTERAIRINAQLVTEFGSEIVLHPQTCLPHITLAMGCMEEDAVSNANQSLRAAMKTSPVESLVTTGVATWLSPKNEQVSGFVIAKTVPLQRFHERIMGVMDEFFSYDISPEMVYGQEPVPETTLAWIRTFRDKSAFGAFFPHITLGYGMVTEPMTFPMEFNVARLALCHLGNHCTCRKALVTIDL